MLITRSTTSEPWSWCVCFCVVQVGDYVLSPDIVVERKALPDLFASLGSGRLYNQVRHHCMRRLITAHVTRHTLPMRFWFRWFRTQLC